MKLLNKQSLYNIIIIIIIIITVKYYVRWPVTVTYFTLISLLDVRFVFVLLSDNVKFVFGFFLYPFCSHECVINV